jgi:NAD(P)-dependent dehydrogenase (short-subunit alcohol dehydrogenase family)
MDYIAGIGGATVKLEKRTALVTGGAVRIGRAICEALAAEGCNVAVHFDRSAAEARALVERLSDRGVHAWAVRAHLEGESDCARLIARCASHAGRLDILVNNASVFNKNDLGSSSEAVLLAELRTNALVPFFLTRAFAAQVGRRGPVPRGKVVNLLDRRVAGVEQGCVPYLLSKKLLAEFTRVAALELAPAVTVNGVAPGAVLPPPSRGGRRVREAAGSLPMGRRVTPAEVAAAVVYLLQSDAVTGQILFADGGQHLGAAE